MQTRSKQPTEVQTKHQNEKEGDLSILNKAAQSISKTADLPDFPTKTISGVEP